MGDAAPIGTDGVPDAKSRTVRAALGESQSMEVRDKIEGILAAVPCARLKLQDAPGGMELTLRGLIPDEAFREPLLSLLGDAIGAGTPIESDLRILPRPQCTVLSAIADLGLPQSDGQGYDMHLPETDSVERELEFGSGSPLSLDLCGAEFPAWIYVDYFDIAGEVTHLIPNTRIPPQRVPANTPIDTLRAVSGPSPLGISFGPPYGQEVIVAFAASEPLYEGLRPISEPASDYLSFLRTQITRLRQSRPGFRGEWVYLLVSTHP